MSCFRNLAGEGIHLNQSCRRRRLPWRTLLCATVLSLASSVYAAQDGIVITDHAVVHKDAIASSAGVAKLAKGQALRLSDKSKDGWFKTQIKTAKGVMVGWIKVGDVQTNQGQRALRSSGVSGIEPSGREVNYHRWSVLAFYDVDLAAPAAFQTAASVVSNTFMIPVMGLQVGYRPTIDWTVSLQGTHWSFSRLLSADSGAHLYGFQGWVVGALAEYTWLRALPFKLGVSLGGGISLSAAAQLTSPTTTATTASSFMLPYGQAKLSARWFLGESFALELEGGYRLLAKSGVPFADGSTVDLKMSGIFAGVGLGYEF